MAREDPGRGYRPGWGCFTLILVFGAVAVLLLWILPGMGLIDGDKATFLGAGLLLAFLVPVVIAAIMPVVGMIWAPFGALICTRVARTRGLDSPRFALAGAVYSILFFWPWVYLILRMHNKTIPGAVVRGAYVLLYGVVWPSSSLVFFPLIAFFPESLWYVPLLLLFLSSMSWYISQRMLISWHKNHGNSPKGPVTDVLPNRAYIMPFAYALAWILIPLAIWGWDLLFLQDG